MAVCLAAMPAGGVAGAACPAGVGEPVEIAAVVSGSVVRLEDGGLARLAGIAVPAPGLESDSIPPLAESARSVLEGLVAGRTVDLVPASDGEPDRHGRVPAYLRLADGRSVQEVLIGQGLARAQWLPGEEACFAELKSQEKTAESRALGVWSSPDYATRDAEDAASLLPRAGHFELVEGRILSVGHGSRMIFLDFGRDIRRDFTVMVSSRVAEALESAGTPVDGLADRRIRVRGVIEESGGPAIRLNDAAELEVLE